jgi:hypothetical protein
MARDEASSRQDVAGTVGGLIIFVVGVALLFFVFTLAVRLFNDPGVLTAAAASPSEGGPVAALIPLAARVVSLFIMLLAGSLVASKGIHLYTAAR